MSCTPARTVVERKSPATLRQRLAGGQAEGMRRCTAAVAGGDDGLVVVNDAAFRENDGDARSPAKDALDGQRAAVQLHDHPRQRQAQSRPARRVGIGRADLVERHEHAVDIFGGHADSGIGHGDLHPPRPVPSHRYLDRAVRRRKLAGVGDQLRQHLADALLIDQEHHGRARQVRADRRPERSWLAVRQPNDAVDQVRDADAREMQLHVAVVDARHLQHVLDDVEQVPAAPPDVFQISQVFRRADRTERLQPHGLGESDDRVERRAELVAHVGKKGGFRPARLFRGDCRFHQAELLGVRLGDDPVAVPDEVERDLVKQQEGQTDHGKLQHACVAELFRELRDVGINLEDALDCAGVV
jgi:hypothetical protein